MPTQTSYNLRHAKAFEGMIAEEVIPTLISREVEEAAGIAFGKPVVKGTGDNQIIVPNAIGENNYVGIAVRDPAARLLSADGVDKYAQRDTALVMTKGIIWVRATGNVTAGSNVYVTEATAGLDDASGSNIFQIPNAKWLDTVTAGNLSRVELR